MRREAFKFWDLVRRILVTLRYIYNAVGLFPKCALVWVGSHCICQVFYNSLIQFGAIWRSLRIMSTWRTYPAPWHYLIQWRRAIDWTLTIRMHWYFNKKMLSQGNTSPDIVCEIIIILIRHICLEYNVQNAFQGENCNSCGVLRWYFWEWALRIQKYIRYILVTMYDWKQFQNVDNEFSILILH